MVSNVTGAPSGIGVRFNGGFLRPRIGEVSAGEAAADVRPARPVSTHSLCVRAIGRFVSRRTDGDARYLHGWLAASTSGER